MSNENPFKKLKPVAEEARELTPEEIKIAADSIEEIRAIKAEEGETFAAHLEELSDTELEILATELFAERKKIEKEYGEKWEAVEPEIEKIIAEEWKEILAKKDSYPRDIQKEIEHFEYIAAPSEGMGGASPFRAFGIVTNGDNNVLDMESSKLVPFFSEKARNYLLKTDEIGKEQHRAVAPITTKMDTVYDLRRERGAFPD